VQGEEPTNSHPPKTPTKTWMDSKNRKEGKETSQEKNNR
jgi:hypothetical protein